METRYDTLAACEASVATRKDPVACYVMPDKAGTGGSCAWGLGADGARRGCSNDGECCGGLRLKESDETNTGGEFCYTKSATMLPSTSSFEVELYKWWMQDFDSKALTDLNTAAKTKEAWTAWTNSDTKTARDTVEREKMQAIMTGQVGTFSCKYAGMKPDDMVKCKAAITAAERLGAGMIYKKQLAMVKEGFGAPDLMAVEKESCFKDALKKWTDIKDEALSA